jgi:hypothetical protein
MCPFECDLCIFRKLQGRSPEAGNPMDNLLLGTIRRMNLDAFWCTATATVQGNKDKLDLGIRLSGLVGLEGPYIHEGPFPDYDHCGYEAAVQILLYSKRKGRTTKSHLQFDTIRKVRTGYSNQVRASPQMNRSVLSLGDQKGNYQRLTLDPCASMWFSRFMKGCKNRMGQKWRPNKGMSVELLVLVLAEAENRIEGAASVREAHRWVVFHTYAVVYYVISLRGSEGLLLDLEGLHRHWSESEDRHVIIALQGQVKGETGDRDHLLPCVGKTASGIDVRKSLKRLMGLKSRMGFVDGPAISDSQGQAHSTRDMSDSLFEILDELYDSHRHLFPEDISTKDMLRERYQAFRTFRRTSDTRATEMGVSKADIDMVNRWESAERAKGKRQNMPMRMHYTQVELILQPFLRYTGQM